MARPLIVVLRLLDFNILVDTHAHLLSSLEECAEVRHVKNVAEARRYLTSTVRPHAVLVADKSLTPPTYRDIRSLLVEYVKAGGTAVYCGIFSSCTRPSDFKLMFEDTWGLPWVSGSYHRETFAVNPRVASITERKVNRRYNVKALQVDNVSLNDAIYLSIGEANALPKPGSTNQRTPATIMTPAAFTTIGLGRVGYVGDVNGDDATTKVVLAMCLHPLSGPSPAPGSGKPATGHVSAKTAQMSNPAGDPKRRILILSLQKEVVPRDLWQPVFRALRKNAIVNEVQSADDASRALSASPAPNAILVTDAAVTQPEGEAILNQLIRYLRDTSGGTVVFGVDFSGLLGDARAFFSHWGLQWDKNAYDRATFELNPAGLPSPLSADVLLPSFFAKALHIKGPPEADAVYRERDPDHAGLAAFFTPFGKGHIGYVGDTNGEWATLRLLVEMCGVKIMPGDMGPRTHAIQWNNKLEPTKWITEDEVLVPNRSTGTSSSKLPIHTSKRPRESEVTARAQKRNENRRWKISNADLLMKEGDGLFRLEKLSEAADKYRAAALLAGPHPVYLGRLAAVMNKSSFFKLADSAATRALMYDPKDRKSLYQRMISRKRLSRFTAAKTDVAVLLSIDPTDEQVLKERNEIVLQDGSKSPRDWPEDSRYRGLSMNVEDLDAALDIPDESDSEDFCHSGNGTPCKYYNSKGCRNGTRCRYSHAPDAKSVRDELGRNVCVYWLVGQCRYENRCLYAHDSTYLPERGWWTDERRLARLRETFEEAVIRAPLPLGVQESILAEALAPTPWRRDQWASVAYNMRHPRDDDELEAMGKEEDDEFYGSGEDDEYY